VLAEWVEELGKDSTPVFKMRSTWAGSSHRQSTGYPRRTYSTLDTYRAERHPIAARVLKSTMARQVSLRVQHAPHVDVFVTFDVEDDVRVAFERPRTQPGDLELVAVARGARVGAASHVCVSTLQRADEAERGRAASSARQYAMTSSTSRLARARATTGFVFTS